MHQEISVFLEDIEPWEDSFNRFLMIQDTASRGFMQGEPHSKIA
jgi:hypothetical protein